MLHAVQYHGDGQEQRRQQPERARRLSNWLGERFEIVPPEGFEETEEVDEPVQGNDDGNSDSHIDKGLVIKSFRQKRAG